MIHQVEYNKDDARIPIKMWLKDIEDGALEQARNLASLPFAFRHIALMPDAHQGFGMPIGGVLCTKNVIIPNAVGVDIGCGMTAMRLPKVITENDIRIEFLNIKNRINKEEILSIRRNGVPHMAFDDISLDLSDILLEHAANAEKQLGTLGGGNHFIEFQKDEENQIWLMVHSGSRNLGKQVADYHNKVAVEVNKKYYSSVPESHKLAFFPLDSDEGVDYFNDMKFCVEYAKHNRRKIMSDILRFFGVKLEEEIDCCHNFARLENHYDKNVVVHRKGATPAKMGELGLIPGSQGTKSYVVEGKGNKESFSSCSHGAGRTMSRKKAKDVLDLKEEMANMDNQGICHNMRSKQNLDEASGAYKDISVVMANQDDLVSIKHELQPIAVIKNQK